MRIYVFILVVFFHINLFAQNSFYDVDHVSEIRLSFYDSNWDYILDSFYVQGDNQRILSNIIIDGDSYDSVGVRYKGFSSVSVNTTKNPFNIELDYIIDNQDHKGVNKLKLSNVIHDPSFIREVLSYEIIRKYMPASLANFANVYINDTLWGLYVNVENVDDNFLIESFDDRYDAFFKCNPENLNIQSGGENSNLSNTHGSDSINYYSYYDLRSDYGWEKLYNLIDTLNNHVSSVDHVLNVDRSLWMHALNYSLVNFDSYIGYSQNYYLYRNQSHQFNPIMWDLNMSFGTFRLTDASSLYFSGFDISQAQEIDPLTHYNYMSISPRPLMTKLFEDQRLRKMYIAHIRTIIQENFMNQNYYARGQYLQSLIDNHVQNDVNKFYSYSDFLLNLTDQVSIPFGICPGITQLMNARSNYLSNYYGYSGHPLILNHAYSPQNFVLGDDLWVTSEVSDANHVFLYYRFGHNQRFQSLEMYDDGSHNDGMAGDGTYGVKLSNISNSFDYYFYADNDSAGYFLPERAAYEYFSAGSNVSSGDLVINEVMSRNVSTVTDPSGSYDDWIELYNTTSTPLSTNNLYLTDNPANLLKWKLPNHVIPPYGYFVIWADEDGGQGQNHANFRLTNLGEQVILSNADTSYIDDVFAPTQPDDISYARLPNGTGSFTMLSPTFNKNNDPNSLDDNIRLHKLDVFPTLFSDRINIRNQDMDYVVVDALGNVLYVGSKDLLETSSWDNGVYFIYLEEDPLFSIKLVKIH